jgi:hypothetical protein
MRHRSAWPIVGLLAGALACGDGGTSPAPVTDAAKAAARFDRLADSVEQAGFSPSAEALRHAAEIVRLTGRATPVILTIDGTARNFLAVGEQIDFPLLACSWSSDSGSVGPGDSVVSPPPATPAGAPECVVVDTTSMRTLIAWEPERLSEVVRIVSDVGSTAAEPGVPDVMAGLPVPAPAPPDSVGGSGGSGGGSGGTIVPPGFLGEYLVGDVGSWYAVEGSQSNALLDITGACTAAHATFDWARFACEAARLRFEFAMRVEPGGFTPLAGRTPTAGPEGSHELSLAASDVDGVRLTVEAWTPPPPVPVPVPGPPTPGPPVPVDSTLVQPQ